MLYIHYKVHAEKTTLDTYKKQRSAIGTCLVYSLYQAFSPLNSRYTSPY